MSRRTMSVRETFDMNKVILTYIFIKRYKMIKNDNVHCLWVRNRFDGALNCPLF